MALKDLPPAWQDLYNPSPKEPSVVELPPLQCLQLDGKGDPSGPEYGRSVEAIYAVAYALKFMIQKEGGPKFSVMPLEGLWWSDRVEDFLEGERDKWQWTSILVQPDFVSPEQVKRAMEQAAAKKELPALAKMRFETFREGLAVQIMHIGPYTAERPTIERLHAFAETSGLRLRGKHHEIYLGDPRRVAPEKLKTIIRHPVERIG